MFWSGLGIDWLVFSYCSMRLPKDEAGRRELIMQIAAVVVLFCFQLVIHVMMMPMVYYDLLNEL